MLNTVAKCLLVLTSLSPVLLTLAVNELERGGPWATSYWIGLAAFFLAALCKALLRYAQENAQRHLLYVKEFENKDQEMLTFLFIYLLPFVRGSTFASEWITSVFVLSIITAAIATTGAFHFNPVMRPTVLLSILCHKEPSRRFLSPDQQGRSEAARSEH